MPLASTVPAERLIRRLRAVSDIERAARQIAGKMVARALNPARLVRQLDHSPDELLAALGLDSDHVPEHSRSPQKREARRKFVALLGKHAGFRASGPDITVEPLDRNLEQLTEALSLSRVEHEVLRTAVIIGLHKPLADFLESHTSRSRFHSPHALSGLFDMPAQRLVAAMSPQSRLVQLELVESNDYYPLTTDSSLSNALMAPDFHPARFLAHKLKRSAPAQLAAADFSHIQDVSRLRQHLDRALTRSLRGVNVLMYGPPGTGKTELARHLAESLDASLWEVPVCTENGEVREGARRAAALTLTRTLLKSDERNLLLFDEVEDLFGSADGFDFFGSHRSRARSTGKGWVNDQLENNSVPTFWLCNDISAIDHAYLRRFDEVIELRPPTRSVRRRIVDRYLPDETVSPVCRSRIAEIDRLPPAQVERVGKVLSSMTDATQIERDEAAQRLLENFLRATGVCHRLPLPVLPEHYDPDLLNANVDLVSLADSLQAGGSGRVLFYGPPGTGKTAFAHHLGQRLDRPVLARRASDLIDCYVGMTERNIAAAFRDAEAEGAILLLDEVDSFLRDRSDAQRNWEVTQVNELLTQMEHFEGVLIASTNLVDNLDPASLRRFDYKVHFDALGEAQRLALFQRLCADLGTQPQPHDLAAINRIDRLTPGDFAVIRRQLRHRRNIPAAGALVERLRQEVAMKREINKRSIGFAPTSG